MSRLFETLKKGVLVCDGAMGTQLMQAGMQAGECSEVWNVEHPEKVLAIQKNYVAAGVDIILTNTFGGSRWALSRHGKNSEVEELNTAAAEIARQAVGEAGLVAGDVGPTGEMPLPYGTKKEGEFTEVFAEEVKALASAGVDAIFVQTMSAPEELQAAVRATKENTDLPVAASSSYSAAAEANEYRTMMGAAIEKMVETALAAGADIVGANCGTVDIVDMVRIVARIRKLTERPILVEPNAGKPVVEGDKTTYPQTPEQMAEHVQALIDAGANIIGGCCGTTPEHIAAIARIVRG